MGTFQVIHSRIFSILKNLNYLVQGGQLYRAFPFSEGSLEIGHSYGSRSVAYEAKKNQLQVRVGRFSIGPRQGPLPLHHHQGLVPRQGGHYEVTML